MRRLLISCLATLIAFTFLVIAAFAVRSLKTVDEFAFARSTADGNGQVVYDVQCLRGDVYLFRAQHPNIHVPRGLSWRSKSASNFPSLAQGWLGFSSARVPGGRGITFPLWAPLLLALCPLSVLTMRATRRYRRRLRVVNGFCVGCGYDLRGSPDRCPECGRTATPA